MLLNEKVWVKEIGIRKCRRNNIASREGIDDRSVQT